MFRALTFRSPWAISIVAVCCASAAFADESLDAVAGEGRPLIPRCLDPSSFHDAWIKVVERVCLKCHTADGDASDSEFVLRDISRLPPAERAAAIVQNCTALAAMAASRDANGQSRLLAKATGGQEHGGGEALKPGSTELQALADFVRTR